jgi:hypothetical protein
VLASTADFASCDESSRTGFRRSAAQCIHLVVGPPPAKPCAKGRS